MQIRVLAAADVERCLTIEQAIDSMAEAFEQLSSGSALVPHRLHLDSDPGMTLVMGARLPRGPDLCVKIVSFFPHNAEQGLPAITGLAVVIDPSTGVPQALMDAASLTTLRTGGAGGLAARLLAREDARALTVFGGGVEARIQLAAVCAVRSIETVTVVDLTEEAAQPFVQEVQAQHPELSVSATADRRAAVRDADIIVCATTSKTPVFDGNDIRDGVHITAIGSFTPEAREVDEVAVRRARIFVDSRSAAGDEAGELTTPGVTIEGEIGELVAGAVPGRTSDRDVTFFKSVGVAVQDAVAARIVLEKARQLDVGQLVEI